MSSMHRGWADLQNLHPTGRVKVGVLWTKTLSLDMGTCGRIQARTMDWGGNVDEGILWIDKSEEKYKMYATRLGSVVLIICMN